MGVISTALMHDIVAHELTHALLDSQRPHFMEPTGPDVAGFHEGFADLIALMQHFQYREPLMAALADSGGTLLAREQGERPAHWLCRIARQFGAADDLDALRRADRTPADLSYKRKLEEHADNALFEQFGKKIFLTPAGSELLQISRAIIQQFEAAENASAP